MTNGFFDRISFPTEYHDRNDLKSSLILLFITCLAFFVLSSIMILFDLFVFSKTLLMGTIAYELILFFLLQEYTKKFISSEIKNVKAKKTLGMTSSIIFSALMIVTLLTLVYTMVMPTPIVENKFISLTIPLFLIVLPTFFWHELVMFFKKKVLGRFNLVTVILFLICLSIMPGIVQAQEIITTTTNVTSNQTVTGSTTGLGGILNTFTQGIGYIEQGVDFFNQAKNFTLTWQGRIQDYLNLTPEQTQIITIVAILIGVFLLLKFLSVIVKWIIVILIAWIIIQLVIT